MTVVSCLQTIKTYGLPKVVEIFAVEKTGSTQSPPDQILQKETIAQIKVSHTQSDKKGDL